ncbi:hypothetical protein G7046_g8352 [Stylonectria norvegica]|nr:hypothetical protein G7046_g8352 [Stylonectria norvegica]
MLFIALLVRLSAVAIALVVSLASSMSTTSTAASITRTHYTNERKLDATTNKTRESSSTSTTHSIIQSTITYRAHHVGQVPVQLYTTLPNRAPPKRGFLVKTRADAVDRFDISSELISPKSKDNATISYRAATNSSLHSNILAEFSKRSDHLTTITMVITLASGETLTLPYFITKTIGSFPLQTGTNHEDGKDDTLWRNAESTKHSIHDSSDTTSEEESEPIFSTSHIPMETETDRPTLTLSSTEEKHREPTELSTWKDRTSDFHESWTTEDIIKTHGTKEITIHKTHLISTVERETATATEATTQMTTEPGVSVIVISSTRIDTSRTLSTSTSNATTTAPVPISAAPGLSKGQVAGIVIGLISGLLFLGVGILLLRRLILRRRNDRRTFDSRTALQGGPILPFSRSTQITPPPLPGDIPLKAASRPPTRPPREDEVLKRSPVNNINRFPTTTSTTSRTRHDVSEWHPVKEGRSTGSAEAYTMYPLNNRSRHPTSHRYGGLSRGQERGDSPTDARGYV